MKNFILLQLRRVELNTLECKEPLITVPNKLYDYIIIIVILL